MNDHKPCTHGPCEVFGIGTFGLRKWMVTVICMVFAMLLCSLSAEGGEGRPSPAEQMADLEFALEGERIAVAITDGFHDQETLAPMAYVEKWGAETTVIGPEIGEVTAYNSPAVVEVSATPRDVSPEDFAALIIPGGHSPGRLRKREEIVGFVQDFHAAGRPIAAICHGPEVLIAADVITGRTVTAYGDIREELTEAGAKYVDRSVVQDNNLITSRVPADIPDFKKVLTAAICEKTRLKEIMLPDTGQETTLVLQSPEPEVVTVRWETEDREPLTEGERLLRDVLSEAPEYVDPADYEEIKPDEDPLHKKLARGEWEEANFASLTEAVKAFVIREALSEKYTIRTLLEDIEFGPQIAAEMLEELAANPDRYVEDVDERLRRTKLYQQEFNTERRREWDRRHYRESEEELAVMYRAEEKPEAEYQQQEAISLRFPGTNRWIHKCRMEDLQLSTTYYLRLRDEGDKTEKIQLHFQEEGLH